MYQVKAIDEFSVNEFAGDIFQVKDTDTPDAVLVRSSKVPDELITQHLLLVARSGIGTNTINIDACTQNGTAVFNTPGANANAVKELVLQVLFTTARPLQAAINHTAGLKGDHLQQQAEATRYQFIGHELYGKTIGIIGLGAIGQRLADSCYHLGMQVVGYNRSPKNLQFVQQLETIEDVLAAADFVVLLLPLTETTEGLMNADRFKSMRHNAVLLNFGRGELVDNAAVIDALNQGQFQQYITDFPTTALREQGHVVMLPHLGGNTVEALSQSANLTLQNTRDFLETGVIRASVNFPTADLPFNSPHRLTVFFKSRSAFWNDIATILSRHHVPVLEMISNMRGEHGYMLVNIDLLKPHLTAEDTNRLIQEISSIDGAIRVRILTNPSALSTHLNA
ncbi:NAD(P)-dependent oxidoreductase [Secundilactobacillus mixtipabuli]|uniref:D-3-phosphoglycerate dehydrogenase n=1 Tax=Secundilactobacillus mixtipabuli TaxID=1435342 RepID=A0A1Z5IBP1_9LACO|nr:NAD(P)-dependent oxidoreductase [Secundilactobacillus mixtipabuli]GAW99021.1 D-3-phosphoglycerate dehydrogenase [Secundilactobacillus mixtipabuli]